MIKSTNQSGGCSVGLEQTNRLAVRQSKSVGEAVVGSPVRGSKAERNQGTRCHPSRGQSPPLGSGCPSVGGLVPLAGWGQSDRSTGSQAVTRTCNRRRRHGGACSRGHGPVECSPARHWGVCVPSLACWSLCGWGDPGPGLGIFGSGLPMSTLRLPVPTREAVRPSGWQSVLRSCSLAMEQSCKVCQISGRSAHRIKK